MGRIIPIEEPNDIVVDIMQHLNSVVNKKFKSTSKTNIELINYWSEKGFNKNDFIQVIDFKAHQWLNSSVMSKYLKPSTLFSRSNFRRYFKESERWLFANIKRAVNE